MFNISHAYLVGDMLLAPVWLIAFLYRRDLRHQLLIMSVLGALLSVVFAPPFLNDYWHPLYAFNLGAWPLGGLEDFLNGFFVVGIASVAYEELFRKKMMKNRIKTKRYVKYIPFAFVIYFVAFLFPVYMGWWSLYAAVVSFFVLLAVMLVLRHDLIQDAVISGLLLGAITMVGYLIFLKLYPDSIRFWQRNNLNAHSFLNVPLGELLWAFTLGAASGPVYEFFAGFSLTTLKKTR